MDSCDRILKVFADYRSWTGQAINSAKSCVMFSKAFSAWRARRLARRLGFRRRLEMTYLGIPLKLAASRSNDFVGMIQLANDRIRGWGVRSLSMAGRLALLNSVLTSLPIFAMSHCLVPSSVLRRIERIARDFLWNGQEGSGVHYVAWAQLCKPKDLGGLGIHDLSKWRGALLGNMAWRFLEGRCPLFASCILARYGRPLCTNSFKRADSPAWKMLCMGYETTAAAGTWEVGDGSLISFLHDNWVGGRSLSKWPTYLNCTVMAPCWVSEILTPAGCWDTEALGLLCGADLVELIIGMPAHGSNVMDVLKLPGRYLGRSASSVLYRAVMAEGSWADAWIWKAGLRPRVALFWWRVCFAALPTRSWLLVRGLTNDAGCPWGCGAGEDIHHLMVGCEFMVETRRVLGEWGFHLGACNSVAQIMEWLRKEYQNRQMCASAILFCHLIYQLWHNRLAKVHGRPIFSPRMVASKVLGDLACPPNSPIRFWDTTAPRGSVNHFWCPPPHGWFKVNLDGALSLNGRGGCAAVLRDHTGRLIAVKGLPVRHWDSGEVEMKALFLIRDFLMDWVREGVGLIVEGDSANVITAIQGGYLSLKHGVVTEDTRPLAFLLSFHCILFSRVPREANWVADYAAHVARDHEFLWVGSAMAPPVFCSLIMREMPL